MLLTTGPSFEFVKFIQILCWIILPVSLIAVMLTVIFHYKKKRTGIADAEKMDESLTQASPEQMGFTRGDGEYVFFDHSALIGKFKNRLSYNHARYTALRHDFEKLETKYSGLASYVTKKFITNKTTGMGNTYEQMPMAMQEEIAKLSAAAKVEKEELLAKLERISQSYKSLEDENQSLQDQLKIQTGTDDEKNIILYRWKEENALLKEKVAEQQYLHDVLNEKKTQIEFLQTHLEQRIKNNHQSEQQLLQITTVLEETKHIHANDVQALKEELLLKQEDADKLQIVLCGKEEQLEERQHLLASKLEHITWLENTLQETKEQKEILNATLAGSKDQVSALQEQLLREQLRKQAIEQKVSIHKQLLERLYNDLSPFVNVENEQSPVIALRPEYKNQENEEIAVR